MGLKEPYGRNNCYTERKARQQLGQAGVDRLGRCSHQRSLVQAGYRKPEQPHIPAAGRSPTRPAAALAATVHHGIRVEGA